ncbi:M14 family murein peptide amidase A [Dechloromonas sp. ZY10]|uniref:M14 family murein peptide amidase A n=1 Tax=Dechloromonas aquae TaxID=2664436 RepID=UPI003528D371
MCCISRCLPGLPLLLLALLLPRAVLAEDWCAAIGKRLKSVPAAQCRALGLQPAAARSQQGRALMWRDLPPPAKKLASRQPGGRAPRVLVIGGIHGDELTSAALVFRWLPWMQEGEATHYHWRVIPVANPDGLLAGKPTRVNANGVDLNRNFATPDWHKDAHAYWQRKTERDPRRYPGKAASSEPETRWLESEIGQFRPDVIVSVHAPYGLLDYDGPARQPQRFGQLTLSRLGVYPGSLGNYGGVHKNVPVVTIELPHANAMPPAREQRAIWADMLNWLRRNIVARG